MARPLNLRKAADRSQAYAAALVRRAERYAARYSAERRVEVDDWDSPIPYPTDDRMAESFADCVRRPALDEYPAIRAQILTTYAVTPEEDWDARR